MRLETIAVRKFRLLRRLSIDLGQGKTITICSEATPHRRHPAHDTFLQNAAPHHYNYIAGSIAVRFGAPVRTSAMSKIGAKLPKHLFSNDFSQPLSY